jgi:hypothetical protein
VKIGSDRTVLIGAPMKTSAGLASTAIARLRRGTDDMAPGATTWLSMGPRVDEFSVGQLPRQVSLKNENLQCGKRVFINA